MNATYTNVQIRLCAFIVCTIESIVLALAKSNLFKFLSGPAIMQADTNQEDWFLATLRRLKNISNVDINVHTHV